MVTFLLDCFSNYVKAINFYIFTLDGRAINIERAIKKTIMNQSKKKQSKKGSKQNVLEEQ